MYVCICRAVTDGQIRAAVEDGITSMRALRDTLGCSGQCGKCASQVKQIRDEAVGSMDMGDGNVIPIFALA
jgi:bacterioferritin-associated ferredoxin